MGSYIHIESRVSLAIHFHPKWEKLNFAKDDDNNITNKTKLSLRTQAIIILMVKQNKNNEDDHYNSDHMPLHVLVIFNIS